MDFFFTRHMIKQIDTDTFCVSGDPDHIEQIALDILKHVHNYRRTCGRNYFPIFFKPAKESQENDNSTSDNSTETARDRVRW